MPRLRLFYETELRAIALPHGLVWTTDDVQGGAVWAPPLNGGFRDQGEHSGDAPDGQGFRQAAAPGFSHEAAGGREGIRASPPIGIWRSWASSPIRGRGIGTELMHPALETLDARGRPAYLEASSVRSRALYERHGCAVTGEFNLPSGARRCGRCGGSRSDPDRLGARERRSEMGERWFSEEELREMSRPTMERAIEAIERGDAEEAKRLCEEMKHESQFMHDLLVDGVAGLISFVKEKLGDEGVEEAWQ